MIKQKKIQSWLVKVKKNRMKANILEKKYYFILG